MDFFTGACLGWIFYSVIAGIIAYKKGYSGIGFFLLSMALSPILGIAIALIMKSRIKDLEPIKLDVGMSKKCPFCAEPVKNEAIICRFCGRDISNPSDQDMPIVYEINPSMGNHKKTHKV